MTPHTFSAPFAPGVVLAVAVGGAVGACLRWGIALAVTAAPGGLPVWTVLVNVSGSLAIGLLTVYLTAMATYTQGRAGSSPLVVYLRPFVGVGVLGGFTTFSTYALDVVRLLTSEYLPVGLVYLVLTPVLAVTAALLGHQWGAWLFARESEAA